METYFYGDLVQGEELEKTAILRQKEYRKVTTLESDKDSYLSQGWELKKKYKRSVKLYKKKEIDELLEDKVWLLFKNMGFTEMNKDRNFKIQAGPIKKQIDVFAKDGCNVFVIECKAQSEKGPRDLTKDIHEILNLRNDIMQSLQKHYGQKLRVSFLLVTENITWSSTDEKLASANRKNSFFFWKENELRAYANLTSQQGVDTRFEMYTILFSERKTKELENVAVPAMRGGKGRKKYYVFVIQPEKLLNGVAYVHRREETNPEEASKAYQRMLKKQRLEDIHEYIEKGGFFPNNIIINFTKKPRFEPFGPKADFGNIAYGILKFPPYYGSAWIIDGQHRLYGYKKSKKRKDATLPVLAFEELDVKDQGNLFVDINQEQKPVSPNLLWDLYPDIYYGAKDDECQKLRAISLIVKRLNSESDSPLYKHIYIPSVPRESKRVTNLTMASTCEGLRENRLINREEGEGLLYREDYESTVDFASRIIKAYFEVIARSFPEDWDKGEKGLLRTDLTPKNCASCNWSSSMIEL
jgi:DGQHR domain-containing protein